MEAIPEVSDLDMAFPTRYRELLPKWDALTSDEKSNKGPYCRALESLFFKGGRIAEHLDLKPGVDGNKVARFVAATLGDFGPSHEHKIGGIAHMLAKWCDPKPLKGKR